jgi:hypothetical protein
MKAVMVGLAFLAAAQATPTIRSGAITPADLALIVAGLPRTAIDRFSALPPSVRDAFAQTNCRVPQPTTGATANVIAGEFAANGQRDWAALCSDGTLTQIRVVWGGPARCDDRLATTQDADTLVPTAPHVYHYNRTITTASAGQVERLLVKYRTSFPEEPQHDAIDDSIDRVGVVRYCAGSQWLSVP